MVAAIVPWNYPLLLMSWKVAPGARRRQHRRPQAVARRPRSRLSICVSAFEASADRASSTSSPATARRSARRSCVHPGTDLVALTGSVATGKRVGELCARQVKKVHLELGGNDPFIVCRDADLDVAARGAVWAAFLNAGQVCTSAKRFFVFDDISRRVRRPGASRFTKRSRSSATASTRRPTSAR